MKRERISQIIIKAKIINKSGFTAAEHTLKSTGVV